MKKHWEEEELLELKVRADSTFVNAYQYCYIQKETLKTIGNRITGYVQNNQSDCYVEFGKKTGNYTPAFSLQFLQANQNGHVQIEVDMEIDDNDSRCHRCSFYVNSDLGCIEQFGKGIVEIANNHMTEIELNEVQ